MPCSCQTFEVACSSLFDLAAWSGVLACLGLPGPIVKGKLEGRRDAFQERALAWAQPEAESSMGALTLRIALGASPSRAKSFRGKVLDERLRSSWWTALLL